MEQNDLNNNVAQDMADASKELARTGARKLGNGINNVTRKARRNVRKGMKKIGRKAMRAGKKVAMNTVKILLHLLLALWPYILAGLAFILIFWMISSFFVDQEYDSKAETANYQNEDVTEDNNYWFNPQTGKYEILEYSNGNKLFKMYYGFMAQKGFWKVVVDENGNTIQNLVRGDDPKAQKIVDRYNREKEFILNSDLLYLLDSELNAGFSNEFYFPEQFIQPVYHDEHYNLKNLTNDNGELVVQSTKYDKKGKPTDQKVEGVWDYGFGSILQYQKFKEEREKRGELRQTYEWDYEKKKIVMKTFKEGEGKKITETVEGYPKDVYLITKVTNAIGTIQNKVKMEWVRTNETWVKEEEIEIDIEREEEYQVWVHVTNKEGEPLYWKYNPNKKLPEDVEENEQITEETKWPVMKQETRTRWVPDKTTVTQTYEGYVWEKIPRYDGEPNTDGIVGDRYLFDYLTNYESYIPNTVMESFNIKERTGRDIAGLEKIWLQQEALENASSVYDRTDGNTEYGGTTISINNQAGNQAAVINASRYMEFFELYGKRYGVDPYLLLAKAAQESGGRHDEVKNPRAGYGIMQIEAPGTVITSATAFNLETGQEEKMVINLSTVDSVEDNIRAGAMIMASRLKAWDYNIPIALQAYNYGNGAMKMVLEAYASDTGKTIDQVISDPKDTGWIAYLKDLHEHPQKYIPSWRESTYGDPDYIEHVLRYYAGPEGTPYAIDQLGNKHVMDGTIEVGAAIIGNGTSLNKNWYTSLVEAVKNHWNELFEDSPVDAFEHKNLYTWTHHKKHMGENEFTDFMRLYRTFIEGTNYSETKDEWTLEDWKARYKALFENPTVVGVVDESTLKEYEELLKLFPDGFTLPVEKVDKIAEEYNGSILKLSVPSHSAVQSMTAGEITNADVKSGMVEVKQENGVTIKYSGLQNIKVKKGDKVTKGQQIAESRTDLGISITDSKNHSVNPSPIFIVMGGEQIYNVAVVLSYIESVKGYPYKLASGANDPSFGAFDCSGLMQWAFKQVGIHLPRTAQDQYNKVFKISEVEAKPGDLIFFEGTYNAGTPITHVGLYLGNGKFWNAQSKGVRIAQLKNDPLDGDYWGSHRYYFGRITK